MLGGGRQPIEKRDPIAKFVPKLKKFSYFF
jgi:hypothetical protein